MIVLVDNGDMTALADNQFIYNLLPVGHFYDKRYGELWITEEMLKQMEANFGKNPSYEVPVKIGHDYGAKSPGRVIGVEVKPEGLEITMVVDQETAEAINKKQYRYMSAEYDSNYIDKETGDPVGAVLKGVALVNQPGNPFVEPILLDDEEAVRRTKEMEDKEKKELEEMKAKNGELEVKLADMQKKMDEMSAMNASLIAERDKAEAEKRETEVKMFCDKWTGKGVPPAMLEQIKPVLLSRTVNLGDEKEEKSAIKFFDDFFDKMPKVDMTQKSPVREVELSDYDKAISRGKAIAESLNPKGGK